MTGYARIGLAAIGCLLALAGCSSRDPYARDDVWYPTGANAVNLAAQVADPADLAGGRGDPTQHSAAQVKAVTRISTDTPKPLGGLAATTTTGGGGAGAGGAGAGGGDPPPPAATPAGGT